ncbi:MAG TPA: DUF5320 domain-containing protein [Spirochaetota bacterium]|nr:DUF5320 domain-containing protein [Spirochaetota bacterium]HPH03352.1 DUF5320 domain-containing protein [Spirochaetota bacterium]
MPRGDRTGPQGFGSRTGRGLGYCSGYNQPGYVTGGGAGFGGGYGFGGGAGFGGGRRGGRGRGWCAYYAAPAAPVYQPAAERDVLESRLDTLQRETAWIKSRLDSMQNNEGTSGDQQ